MNGSFPVEFCDSTEVEMLQLGYISMTTEVYMYITLIFVNICEEPSYFY